MNNLVRTRVISTLLALAVASALSVPLKSFAGLITWTMKVKNTTKYKAHVEFLYQKGMTRYQIKGYDLLPGDTKKFDIPSPQCAHGFSGYLYIPDGRSGFFQARLKPMGCGGHDKDSVEELNGICCWDVSAHICEKKPIPADGIIQNDIFGFCLD